MAAPGYQLDGLQGTVTSWGNGSDTTTDWHYSLVNSLISPMKATISCKPPRVDTTSIDSSGFRTSRNGLLSLTANMEGYWQKSTPQLGSQGLVTFSGGYVHSGSTPANVMLHVDEWDLSLDWDVVPILENVATGGTAPTWDKFRPSFRGTVTGTVKGSVDSANAMVLPSAYSTAAAAMKLYLNQNATVANSEAFSFNARYGGLNLDVPFGGGLQKYSMDFEASGQVTASSGTTAPGGNIIPCNTGGSAPYTNAITFPTYEATPLSTAVCDKTLVIASLTGTRTASGLAFIKSLKLSCTRGQLIKVSVVAQSYGAWTTA